MQSASPTLDTATTDPGFISYENDGDEQAFCVAGLPSPRAVWGMNGRTALLELMLLD
jgi:hypothetical protein